jgi:hypothetical protein
MRISANRSRQGPLVRMVSSQIASVLGKNTGSPTLMVKVALRGSRWLTVPDAADNKCNKYRERDGIDHGCQTYQDWRTLVASKGHGEEVTLHRGLTPINDTGQVLRILIIETHPRRGEVSSQS